jgi:hypothetical protein
MHYTGARTKATTVEIAVPPAFLENTEADTILNGLLSRLPISFENLLKKCQILVIIPNSDPK